MKIKKALIIAPHADDESFGCGGTIAKLSKNKTTVDLLICTLGYNDKSYYKRKEELERAKSILKISHYEILTGHQEGKMDKLPQVMFITPIENYIWSEKYDAVFIPYPSHHQDHIVIHQACMAAMRPGAFQPNMILMYEYTYPTWVVPDQYNGRFFVDIEDTVLDKMEAINAYKSQLHPDPSPVSTQAAMIMAKTRGLSIGVKFAEMFYVIQMKDII